MVKLTVAILRRQDFVNIETKCGSLFRNFLYSRLIQIKQILSILEK